MKTDLIKHVSQLANLNLTPTQLKSMQEKFDSMIGYFKELQSLDLKGIESTSRVLEEINIFREDLVTPSLTQEEALKNAKRSYNGFFVVDNVLENRDA